MSLVLYFKCCNCGKEFVITPNDKMKNVSVTPEFEEMVFTPGTHMPIINKRLSHACSNHTFGVAEFVYGKKVPE